MAKPRTPIAKAEATGATIKNPARFKARQTKLKAMGPLGEPFARMTEGQKAAWHEFANELPWLARSHRGLVQVACVLRARLNENPELGVTAITTFSAILSKLGAIRNTFPRRHQGALG